MRIPVDDEIREVASHGGCTDLGDDAGADQSTKGVKELDIDEVWSLEFSIVAEARVDLGKHWSCDKRCHHRGRIDDDHVLASIPSGPDCRHDCFEGRTPGSLGRSPEDVGDRRAFCHPNKFIEDVIGKGFPGRSRTETQRLVHFLRDVADLERLRHGVMVSA